MTTSTRPRKPAKPKLTESELAATERARKKLVDPFIVRVITDAEYELAALGALAVLVREATPDPTVVVDDPLAVIANEMEMPRLPDFLEPRPDDTGMHRGLVEELRALMEARRAETAQTELIPVVPGELEPTASQPAWATTPRQWLPVVRPRRRRLFSRRDEEDWP